MPLLHDRLHARFAYLGGMDESIATPRLTNPRTVIKGGSVGIAGKQTGIYPIDSPEDGS